MSDIRGCVDIRRATVRTLSSSGFSDDQQVWLACAEPVTIYNQHCEFASELVALNYDHTTDRYTAYLRTRMEDDSELGEVAVLEPDTEVTYVVIATGRRQRTTPQGVGYIPTMPL